MSAATEEKRHRIFQLVSGITPYNGSRKPEVIDQYFDDVQALFYVYKDPADQRLIFKLLIGGATRTWLDTLMSKPEWQQASGQDVLDQLKQHYYPPNYAQSAIRELARLKRGHHTIAAYLERFEDLLQKIPEGALTDRMLGLFLADGCGEPYASDIRRMGPQTYAKISEYLECQTITVLGEGYGNVPTTYSTGATTT